MERNTTIQISEKVWEYLNNKKRIGEDFNDVLKRLLKIENEQRENNRN
jgi:predicted CopG family antitoxin